MSYIHPHIFDIGSFDYGESWTWA